MKLSCYIIDDEHIARKGLKEYIADTNFLTFAGESVNPMEAMQSLVKLQPDILFLDVQMPKMTGMEFLRTFNHEKNVILTTAYQEFALEGYELEVKDYLLKPITYGRFLKAVNKIFREESQKQNSPQVTVEPHIFVRNDGKITKIVLDEILFVEAMQNYVLIHTDNQRLIVHLSLKGLLRELPPLDFIKVQKSYIINRTKVDEIQGNRLFIKGREIPVSRELKQEVLQKLLGNNFLH